ncbi:MAG: hypothetical protein RMK18_04705 [Armatimonadota bacterium]|nr:hypothetical protein [Armatimonadota bacterium]MCX7777104.1 hypothetical protein [Armatimonadota bacterium]MDW8025151.1 hypothetical protein [Armatimonadota bacterium]
MKIWCRFAALWLLPNNGFWRINRHIQIPLAMFSPLVIVDG